MRILPSCPFRYIPQSRHLSNAVQRQHDATAWRGSVLQSDQVSITTGSMECPKLGAHCHPEAHTALVATSAKCVRPSCLANSLWCPQPQSTICSRQQPSRPDIRLFGLSAMQVYSSAVFIILDRPAGCCIDEILKTVFLHSWTQQAT
jgi:hypothetical protein